MKTINITGGVGAGKSEVLSFLKNNYNCKIIKADDVAHLLMSPSGKCYLKIIEAFEGEDLFDDDVTLASNDRRPFSKSKLSKVIFSNDANRLKLNSIVHPAVKEYILDDIKKARDSKEYDYYFLEAALVIEEGYDKLLDETWYIYASCDSRIKRLIESRGYSHDKAVSIMASQCSEEEFREHATHVFNNDGKQEELFDNIRQYLHCD